MGLGGRVSRIEDAQEPELCADKPCEIIVQTEVAVLPDGREAHIGSPPPALCSGCPEHDKPPHERRIRHVEVVRNAYGVRVGDAEQPQLAARIARIAPKGRGGAEATADGSGTDSATAAPTTAPNESFADRALEQEWLREQELEQERAARGNRRNRGMRLDPRDFGL